MKTTTSALIVVAIIIAGAYYAKVYKASAPTETQNEQAQTSGESKITTADPGKIIEGFNSDLILHEDAQISFSWMANGDGRTGRTVSYVTSVSLQDAYDAYRKYLTDQGFTVTEEDASTYSYMVTDKGSVRVNYAAADTDDGTLVYITEIK